MWWRAYIICWWHFPYWQLAFWFGFYPFCCLIILNNFLFLGVNIAILLIFTCQFACNSPQPSHLHLHSSPPHHPILPPPVPPLLYTSVFASSPFSSLVSSLVTLRFSPQLPPLSPGCWSWRWCLWPVGHLWADAAEFRASRTSGWPQLLCGEPVQERGKDGFS